MIQRRSATICALLLATTTLCAAVSTESQNKFPIFWNVGESSQPKVNVEKYGFVSRTQTQVGGGCSNPGCKSWSQGMFPTINTETGETVNGGVPQNADLSLHLKKIEEMLPDWIPDPEWKGNAVLDFESWTTVWDLNTGHGSWHSNAYQNYSLYLARKEFPSLNDTQVYTKAKEAFEKAATTFFVETLKTCKKIRPNAKWGFYGLPLNGASCIGTGANTKCGYDMPVYGKILKEYAEQQMPIWEASDILYPSIYVPTPMIGEDEKMKAYITSTVNETIRLAKLASKGSGQKGVLPYAWHYYHNGLNLLDDPAMHASLQIPCDLGADGIVMWGSTAQMKNDSYWSWLEKDAGPYTKSFECKRGV